MTISHVDIDAQPDRYYTGAGGTVHDMGDPMCRCRIPLSPLVTDARCEPCRRAAATICECVLDCRGGTDRCSHSGEDWHLHNDETCPVHPHALVVA